MKRRSFVSLCGAAVLAPAMLAGNTLAKIRPKKIGIIDGRFHGRANYKTGEFDAPPGLLHGGRAYLNGKEIKEVWFVDTEFGIIKTYDVFRDGKPHVCFSRADWTPDYIGRDIHFRYGEVIHETLRGSVEVYVR